ncbi:MAG: UMP kinase [Patescibacteria group bacterium]|nr:UMP kinase [Patescibacteria group bacterium]
MAKTLVMSLGGSLIAPDGLDIDFLKKFRTVIINFVKKGNRVVLITGGGNTSRTYQKAAKKINPKISSTDLDWIGIGATRINGELVSGIFGDLAYESILFDPRKKIKTSRPIIVGAGYKPGSSSDKDAVLSAKAFGAKTVINLSNITYVYDKDPSKFKDAKPQEKMTWHEFKKLVGSKWVPGAHVPFDPIATRLAERWGMNLVVMKGSDLDNLKKYLAGQDFKGTVIL